MISSIKNKTILLLVVAITFSLLSVGIILSKILQKKYIQEAITSGKKAHEVLTQNLQEQEQQLTYLAKTISSSNPIISSVSMVSKYQKIADYKPLIFDVEKQGLATALGKSAQISRVGALNIYGTDDRLMAFTYKERNHWWTGFVSYDDQGQPVTYRSILGDDEVWEKTSLPDFIGEKETILQNDLETIRYQTYGNRLAVEMSSPITRSLPDSTLVPVGVIKAMAFLDDAFVDEIVRSSNLVFQIFLPDGSNIGDIPDLGLAQVRQYHPHLVGDEHDRPLIDHGHSRYFVHSHFYELADGKKIYFTFASDKTFLKDNLSKIKQTIVLVFCLSAFLLIPIFIFIANNMISKPINSLVDGVRRFQLGEHDKLINIQGKGELHLLAETFNEMAGTIKEQISTMQKEHDKLEVKVAQRTEELSEAKIFLEGVLENIEDGVVACDKNGVLSFFNRATKIFHGVEAKPLPPEEWASQYDLFLADGETPMNKEEIPLFKVFQGEKIDNLEMVIAPKNGKKRYVVASGRALIDESGEKYGAVVSMHDITEKKVAEEILKKANMELETKIEERTIELKESYDKLSKEVAEREEVERKLRQAHKIEAIGTMAGGIAHDFNNILAAVIGYADMAKDELPDNSQVKLYLGEILKASNRAKDLVRQILSFSRMASPTETFLPINLAHIVRDALKFQRSIIPTTIELKTDIDEDLGMINGDATQIHQVIMNLCTNAVQAMQEQSGTLAVNLHVVELSRNDLGAETNLRPGKYGKLSIGDTGGGIDPQILDKIFDPYFTTKEVGKGSGMGLAVIRGIVKNHCGYITVESVIGQGSTFHVFFPLMEETTFSEETREPEQIPKGTERILFVDDEEMLADLGKTILEKLGYAVTAVTDSSVAMQIFQDDPAQFDIVITDQTMPKIPGSELAKRLLKIRPDIPIILCTGYSTIISDVKAQKIGIREFAMKPVDKNVLARLIRKVLDDAS